MTSFNLTDRTQLQKLKNEATSIAEGYINLDWTRAYLNLADAADRIDAMQARNLLKQKEEEEKRKTTNE